MATFDLTKQIKVVNPHANIDALYGPYDSIADALAGVPLALRVLSRTVAILEGGVPVEYWFKDGITDSDLIPKVPEVDVPTNLSEFINDGDGSSPFATQSYVNSSILTLSNSLDTVITNVTYNSSTKIFTFTRRNGATFTIDMSGLESLPEVVLGTVNPIGTPATGQKVYFRTDTGQFWLNSSGTWVTPGALLQLGNTATTAYRGDRGEIAYNHSQIITGNPHGTTKSDIGLGNVDNTSDANKPVSTAQAAALALKENSANKQNNLTADGTGTKFPTVDAVNAILGLYELISNKTQNLGNSATLYTSQAALNKGINKEVRIINSSSTGFSGSTYTIQPDDKNYWLLMDFASPVNIQFSNANGVIGDEWEGNTIGVGQLTFTAAAGATISKAETSTVKTLERGAVFGVKKTTSTNFQVFGRLEQVLGEEVKNSENIQIITATPAQPLVVTDFGTNGGLTIYVSASAGAVTITLPSAATWAGKILTVIKTDSTVNAVTVKGAGTELINAANTDVLNTQYQTKSYRTNGTQNYIF